MTKADKELYHALNLLWNAVQTISLRIKTDREADKHHVIQVDLLESHKALTRYRTLLRENKG